MPAIPIQRSVSASSQPSTIRSLIDALSSVLPRHPAPETATTPTFPIDRPDILDSTTLQARQAQQTPQGFGVIPTYYNTAGPTPGTVVGIVLGSVAGFLLVIWLLFALTGAGGGAAIAGEEEIVVRRRRSRSPHSRRSRRSSRPEVREYSRSPRRSTVIVEERRAPPRPRSVVVEERRERRVPGDDVVEVIEEDVYSSSRPRRGSGRYSRY